MLKNLIKFAYPKAPISRMSFSTFLQENENHVSLKYVNKSKTDSDFFPDNTFYILYLEYPFKKKNIQFTLVFRSRSQISVSLVGQRKRNC